MYNVKTRWLAFKLDVKNYEDRIMDIAELRQCSEDRINNFIQNEIDSYEGIGEVTISIPLDNEDIVLP